MPGLLDSMFATPSDQASFAISAGLLGASPKLRPVSQALLGGLDQYTQASQAQEQMKAREWQAQLVQMQLEDAQRQRAQAQQRQALARQFYQSPQSQAGSLPGGPTNANAEQIPSMPGGFNAAGYQQALLGQGDLQGAAGASAFMPKAPEDYTLAPGAARYRGGKVIAQNEASDKDDELMRILRAANIDPLSPVGQQLLQDRARKIATHAPATSVNVGLQAPYVGTDAQGNPIVLQPANRPGAAPQLLADPRTGQPIRPPADKKADLSESQAKATTFLGQMTAASKELGTAGGDQAGAIEQFNVMASGTPARGLASQRGQRIRQAQDQWSEAFLRFKTGAATTEAEIRRNVATFFPQIGDGAQVIAQKKRMRDQAQDDMRIAAGRGAAQIDARADTPANSQAATMRFNPSTGKLERVRQ